MPLSVSSTRTMCHHSSESEVFHSKGVAKFQAQQPKIQSFKPATPRKASIPPPSLTSPSPRTDEMRLATEDSIAAKYYASDLSIFRSKAPARKARHNPSKVMFECAHESHQCAKYNIYISKELTEHLVYSVRGNFASSKNLYYYFNMSTALQLNDDQMFIFDRHSKSESSAACRLPRSPIALANLDLFSQSGEALYAIIVHNQRFGGPVAPVAPVSDDSGLSGSYNKPDQTMAEEDTKWKWQVLRLCTAIELKAEYDIQHYDLPQSSRRSFSLCSQLRTQYCLHMDPNVVLNSVWDWNALPQVRVKRARTKQRSNRLFRAKVDAGQFDEQIRYELWLDLCYDTWSTTPPMPIVVVLNGVGGRKGHWLEWVKFVQLPGGAFVGISCCYRPKRDAWSVTGILMDQGDLMNKHTLLMATDFFDRQRYAAMLCQFDDNNIGIRIV